MPPLQLSKSNMLYCQEKLSCVDRPSLPEHTVALAKCNLCSKDQSPDLHNILRQSYDYLMIMSKLQSTYDTPLIYKKFPLKDAKLF